ncbi:hypothetical protein ACT453_59315, partial [Bacillus sp. D-CC]
DFTNRYLNIPKSDAPSDLAPLSLDPPEHTPYRQALMGYFSIPAVRRLEGGVDPGAELPQPIQRQAHQLHEHRHGQDAA